MSTHCSLHDNVSWSIITIIVIVNIFVSKNKGRTRLCGCFLDRNDAIGSILSSLRVQRVDKHHVSIPVLGQLLFDGIWKYTLQFRIQLQKFSDGTDRTILNRFRRTKDDRPPILE